MRSSNPDSRRGFTLAEVVLGVLLLGMTATLLGRAVSDSLRALESNRTHESTDYPMYKVREAVLQLSTRAKIEAGGELEVPTTQASQGESGESGERETVMLRLRWQAEIKSTSLLNVFLLELEVDIEGGKNQAQQIESELIAYRPKWADAQESETLLEAKEDEFEQRRSARGESTEDLSL